MSRRDRQDGRGDWQDNREVKLNVGGEIFTTTSSTLTRCHGSMLFAVGDMGGDIRLNRYGPPIRQDRNAGHYCIDRNGPPIRQDSNGHYCIDRNGGLFKYVLDYLRNSKLCLPDDFTEYSGLEAEAEFYQLQPMLDELRKARSQGKGEMMVEIIYQEPHFGCEPAKCEMKGLWGPDGRVPPEVENAIFGSVCVPSGERGFYRLHYSNALLRFGATFVNSWRIPSDIDKSTFITERWILPLKCLEAVGVIWHPYHQETNQQDCANQSSASPVQYSRNARPPPPPRR